MSEEYGATFVTLVDEEDGTETELELLDTLEYEGQTFAAFYVEDEDPEEEGIVILREVNGEDQYESLEDDELLETVYELFMQRIQEDEEDDAE
ncbi:MAG: DUF1292 domain-containing protein [Oscillospiraceae bacterium]|jgi:hypothetical protein|nr:DUF1292 domain-containing protein [Oscillospiraceae bacterium]